MLEENKPLYLYHNHILGRIIQMQEQTDKPHEETSSHKRDKLHFALAGQSVASRTSLYTKGRFLMRIEIQNALYTNFGDSHLP
jgi:hypothetical protein